MTTKTHQPCRSDLGCWRADGHDGEHLYAGLPPNPMTTEAGKRLLEQHDIAPITRFEPSIQTEPDPEWPDAGDGEPIHAHRMVPAYKVAEARATLVAELTAAVEGLPATPFYTGDAEAAMCPNCVTPWKCNGPHVLPHADPRGWDVDRAAVLTILANAGKEATR